MLDIPGSTPFADTGWQLNVIQTPAVTLSTYWRNGEPPLVIGLSGPDSADAARALICFIDRLPPSQLHTGNSVPCTALAPFDACGMVSGVERTLLRGAVEDDSLLQILPLYRCELQPNGSLPPLQVLGRWTKLLDRQREPQPWFQFRMQGGPSQLQVAKWGMEQVNIFESFIAILAAEAGSWLEVRNRADQILRLPDASGWTDARARVRHHIRQAWFVPLQ